MSRLSYIHNQTSTQSGHLTVRLLVTSTGTRTAKLLRLASAGISDEESAVILHKDLLDLSLGGLVHIYNIKTKGEISYIPR